MENLTKEKVKELVENKFKFLIKRYTSEINKRVSELNNVWFNKTMPSIDVFDSLCHSIKISFGNVYESIIKEIAKENFEILPKKRSGYLNVDTIKEIRSIVDENRYENKVDIEKEVERIKKSQENSRIKGKEKTRNVDIVLKKNNKTFLIEIKSGGKHDMGKAQKIKDEVLTNFALEFSKNPYVESFVALTYNPQGLKEEFSWGFMKHFFVNKKNILVGKDFWNFVGQNNKTYDELTKIFDEIGNKYETDLLGVINQHLNKIPNNPNKVKLIWS